MAEAVYVLCALTSILCAVLLLRGYRTSGARLLLWSSLCFAALALSNVLLVVDLMLLPGTDLVPVRTTTALVGLLILIVGLIWEAR